MLTKKTKMNKRVLVTGGAGFIGSTLVDRLLAEGFSVSVVDDLSNGRREYVNPEARLYRIGLTSPKLGAVIAKEKPFAVFHLAAHIDARVSVVDPIHDAEINIHGSLNLLNACVKYGVKRLVFSSSGGAIYHDTKNFPTKESEAPSPLTPYGISKLAFEYYLEAARHHFGIAYAALRYANVYGPRQDQKGEGGVIGVFCKMLLEGKKPSIFGGGMQTRDFVYVDDVVEANVKALKASKSGVWHVATGMETSVNAVARRISDAYGWTKGFGKGPAVPGDVSRSCLDASKAEKELGWKPEIGIGLGIRRTVAWFKTRR